MRERPGVVTLVAILLFISAVLNDVVGVALIFEKDVSELQNIFGTDAGGLVATGIGELIVAALLLLVGLAIWVGNKGNNEEINRIARIPLEDENYDG